MKKGYRHTYEGDSNENLKNCDKNNEQRIIIV